MKRIIAFLSLSLLSSIAFAQGEIKIEDAAKHEGDSVIICAKIFGGKYFEGSNRSPTLLNMGAKYPDAPLTLVIFGESRATFNTKPEEFYNDKRVCVVGRIVMYKGKPEIIVTDEKQMVIEQ